MKRTFVLLLTIMLALTALALAGCGDEEGEVKAGGGTYTDDLGRTVTLDGVPQRLVSISPACTEILFGLGLGEKVAGVTEYCNYPEEALSVDKVGTFTNPNLETIVALGPDLVLAAGGLQKELLDRMEALGLNVYVVDPTTFAETVETIREVGVITGAEETADEVADDMQARAETIADNVKQKMATGAATPKVFYEIFYENNVWTPGSDSIISDLVGLAGGSNLGDADSSDYYEFSVERLVAEDPDVYLVGSGSMASPGDITSRPGWDGIKAVRDGRVYVVDEDLVYRTGPRLIDGLETIYANIWQQ
jgi:iron complex transport system substrate-binding protein